MLVTVPAKTYDIDCCYHECPYFEVYSQEMTCGHPDLEAAEQANSYARLIISHPECDTGFPEACPLLKGSK